MENLDHCAEKEEENKIGLKISADSNDGYHPLFIVLIILLFHLTIFFINREAILNRITISDFDGYWHLLRVENLYDSGDIYDKTLSRSNAPYGEILHWTSAFDLLLYIGAYAGSVFVGFKDALYWWATFINPILHILTFLILFWTLRGFLGAACASLFGLIMPFMVHVTSYFSIARPDHHGVLLFMFSMVIGLTIKTILSRNQNATALCGIAGGLALWFGIESIVVVFLSIIALGLFWILEKKLYKSNFLFSFFLFLTTLLTLFIDKKPEQIFVVEYDIRSIVHVFLWLSIAAFWGIVALIDRYSSIMEAPAGRLIVAAIGAAASIFFMQKQFPLFFENPISGIDPMVRSIYLHKVTEFMSLFSESSKLPKSLAAYWVMAMPGLLICTVLAWRSKSEKRLVWIYIALLNGTYLFLSTQTVRLMAYVQLCSLIPLSYVLYRIYNLIGCYLHRPFNMVARQLFVFICCLCFTMLPILLFPYAKNKILLDDKKFLAQVCQYLNEDPYFSQRPRRILTSIYLGPLLLYNTPHEVVGTPAHRNEAGILDTYAVMNTFSEEDAHIVIRRRGIQALLIGRPQDGIGDFFESAENIRMKDKEIFHHQLWNGKTPGWLESFIVPESLASKIKIFKVLD